MALKFVYNSRLAKLILGEGYIAITLAKWCFVKGGPRTITPFVRYEEEAHYKQWKKYHIFFPFLYAWEQFMRGYHGNRFEVEAKMEAADKSRGRV